MNRTQVPRDRYTVPALERGLRLLRCFTRERPSAGLADLARELGLSRATVFRLLHTLELLGFLERDEQTKHYRLGPAVLSVGFEYLAGLDLPDVARSVLENLRDETGSSTHLAIRDGREIVYLGRYPSRRGLTSNVGVGSRLEAHASTMGRVLLADMRDDAIAELYRGRRLDSYTDQTPRTVAELLHLVRQDRKRGCVIGRSFYEAGVVSIAAPVRDVWGEAVAAISLTVAENAVSTAAIDGLRDAVGEAAEEISRRLGYAPTGRAAAE